MWIHLAARATYPHLPFENQELARHMWSAMVGEFPHALGAVLMPDHVHLILPEEKLALRRLRRLLGSISRRSGVNRLWQASSPPVRIPDRLHLRRQIRYVALNPSRAKLCTDPLEWLWSTHRDVVGAAALPWVEPDRLAFVFGEPPREFPVRFHAYVSGDPSVAVTGTPFPRPCPPRDLPQESIGDVLAAAAAALRAPAAEVGFRSALRCLFINLAQHQGWKQTETLARVCGVTPRAIQLLRLKPPSPGLKAATLCLGDRRLREKRRSELLTDLRAADFALREVKTAVWRPSPLGSCVPPRVTALS